MIKKLFVLALLVLGINAYAEADHVFEICIDGVAYLDFRNNYYNTSVITPKYDKTSDYKIAKCSQPNGKRTDKGSIY